MRERKKEGDQGFCRSLWVTGKEGSPLTDDCLAGVLSISGLWQMPESGSLGRKDVLRAQQQRLSSMGVQTLGFRLKARQNVATAGTRGQGRVGLGPRYSTGNLFPLTRPPLPHCCHLATFRLGIRQWVHPLAKVKSSGPSHIPQIYQPVEYLTYSKHNRVSGQAGQPTIFTNTAKKEQKASEFGG